jgi:hypothetical protein
MAKLFKTLVGGGLAASLLCIQGVPPTKYPNVHYSSNVLSAFEWGYAMVTERAGYEAGWCLYGRHSPYYINITRAEYPVVKEATSHSIVFSCRHSDDYLGRAHSHNTDLPNVICSHSGIDKKWFYKIKRRPLVSTVVCKDNLETVVEG